jgi:tetratricopeptide (TPR) repeat protein
MITGKTGKTRSFKIVKSLLFLILALAGCDTIPKSTSYFEGIFEVSRETEIRLLGKVPQAREYREKLDLLAQEISKGFSPSASLPEKISRMNAFLYDEWELVPDTAGKDIRSSCLTRVLDERKGSCVGITGLFLCLSEKLNLPLHAVLLSGHVFIRYENGNSYVNVETLRYGISRTDSFYQAHFAINQNSEAIRNLTRQEFIGVCYFNLGNAYHKAGWYEDSILRYREALRRFPKFLQAGENLEQARQAMVLTKQNY